jgi:hypothetical protein
VAILRRGLLRSPGTPHLSEVKEGLDPRLLDDFHPYASDPALAASLLDGALVDWLVSDGTARATRSSTTSPSRTRGAV